MWIHPDLLITYNIKSIHTGNNLMQSSAKTVTAYLNAPGTGADVWEVGPFNETSLYTQVPAVAGTAPLARTPGPAVGRQTVTYSLPTRLAKPNTAVSLSLTLPNTGDGTGYWGTNGPATQPPPTLVITYR